MQIYSEFRPTQFDCRGLCLPDRQSWLVAPVMRTRDSGPLDQSNFESALKALGGESDTVEIHRFGHWGTGWFEIIIVDPTSPQAKTAEDLESALSDYPVLDDQDLSSREWDDYIDSWNNCGLSRDFAKLLAHEFELSDLAYNVLDDLDCDTMREFYQTLTLSGDYYETCDNGANFGDRVKNAAKRCDRKQIADFIKSNRS